ncbi:MerR family transcriptional regulator [Salininema proteolyticum]|uniref:MerR family transcriptional regulator n=1 Tax=Salininema proteolyticum TaxID=1607685 RepID=A0ABV8TU76_9ACTN
MAWSTREIAELAGTSLRAVRHYHDIGLLDEPERLSNGYKQYGVAHLVRLLRIKRLADLGVPLPRIAALDEDDDHPEEALRALDAELAASIDRLRRARAELGMILRESVPTELPPEFAPGMAEARMSEADRRLAAVMSRILGPEGLRRYARMLRELPDGPGYIEFDDLAPDADEATRADLAERLAPSAREFNERYPDLLDTSDSPHDRDFVRRSIGKALRDLYNPAQLDVMRRLHDLIGEPRNA